MIRKRFLAVLVLGLALGPACSDDDENPPTKDAAVPDKAVADKGGPDKGAGDKATGDGSSTKPQILKMIPSDGFSNGGKSGTGTPVLLSGKNFAAGAAVYIDGAPQALSVSSPSSVSLQFIMPPNPYDKTKPGKVDVMVFVNGQFSNSVTFQYTVTKAMSADQKGSVTTSSVEAYGGFEAPNPFEAKIYVKGVTDTDTVESKKIKAEVGYGKVGSDPTQESGWMWLPARFTKQSGGYHLYSTALTVPLSQTYDVAYRFDYDEKGTNVWGNFIYADTDETNLTYETAKAATIKATSAPTGYCQKNVDCIYEALKGVCKLSTTSWKSHKCIACLSDADCAASLTAYGPKCDLAKDWCGCKATADCATHPNGTVCMSSTYCGCTSDSNCKLPKKCAQVQVGSSVLQYCVVPSS